LEFLEVLVYAGEANLYNLVERPQCLHRQRPDARRRHLGHPLGTQFGLDTVTRDLGRVLRHRSAGQRPAPGRVSRSRWLDQRVAPPRDALARVEPLASAISFDDDETRRLDPFIRRE